jgi:hypothetical protein
MHTQREFRHCHEACSDCRRQCLETFAQHCVVLGGRHVDPDHAQLMLDCADICQVAESFLARNSEHHAFVCVACASICRICADSCDELDDQVMRMCAVSCRRCAEICSGMGDVIADESGAESGGSLAHHAGGAR